MSTSETTAPFEVVVMEIGRPTARTGVATFLPEPDRERLFCPIISPDDHVVEPPSLFDGRIPTRLRDAAPRQVHDADGVPYWLIDGKAYPVASMDAIVCRPITEWSAAPQRYDEIRRGTWDAAARVRDMDLCGMWASLCFPSAAWGFAGRRISAIRDQEVGLATLRAYNDWVLDEWCATAPERFIPCQVAWLNDPRVAAVEIERNAARGFHAVTFTENPEHLGLPSIHTRHWDPFFAACAATGTTVNLHVGASGRAHQPSSDSPPDVRVALFPVNGIVAVVDWIYSRIPLRFPDLRIVLSEAGISWVPSICERLVRGHRQVGFSPVWSAADPEPLEILRRNFWYTSLEDPSGFRQLDLIGEDRVMIECDYPHPDTSWPNLQSLVESQVGHLPTATVRQVCYENAAELFQHPCPPDEMLASSSVGLLR